MANSQRVLSSILVASALIVGLAACSGNSTASAGKPAGNSGGGNTVATATFSGSESGKVVMNLCTSTGDDSIFVTLDGKSDKLPGEISKDNMGFTGTDSSYVIDKTGPLPSVSTDGNTFTLDGVILKSVIDPTKKLTFSGKISCP